MAADGYAGDLDPTSAVRRGSTRVLPAPAGGYALQRLPDQYTRQFDKQVNLYNWIAKLNFQLNANNSLTLQYSAAPDANGAIDGTIGASAGRRSPLRRAALGVALHQYAHVLGTSSRSWPSAACSSTSSPAIHMEEQSSRPRASRQRHEHHLSERDGPGRFPAPPRSLRAHHHRRRQRFKPCPRHQLTATAAGHRRSHGKVHRRPYRPRLPTSRASAARHALKLGFDFGGQIHTHFRVYTGADTS